MNIVKLAVAPGSFSLDAARKILKTSKKKLSVLQYDLQELKYLGLLEIKQVDSKTLSGKTAMYSIREDLRTFLIKCFIKQSSDYTTEYDKAQRRHFQFYGKKLRKICKMVVKDSVCNALVKLRDDQANYIGFMDTLALKVTQDFRPSENLWVLIASELLLSPDEGQKFFGFMSEQARKDDDLYALADYKCYQIKHLANCKQDAGELLQQLLEPRDILENKLDSDVDAFSKCLSQVTLHCLRGELLAKTNKTSEAKQLLQQAEGFQIQLKSARPSQRFLAQRAVNSLKDVLKLATTTQKTFTVKVSE